MKRLFKLAGVVSASVLWLVLTCAVTSTSRAAQIDVAPTPTSVIEGCGEILNNIGLRNDVVDGAIQHFSRTIELDPTNAEAYFCRGSVYSTQLELSTEGHF